MRIWQRMLVAGLLLQAAMGLRAGTVATIQVKGPIGPATASYIARAIDVAANEQAVCLVLQLDTPGGLLDSTKEIVDTFYSAPIPVVVLRADGGVFTAPKALEHGLIDEVGYLDNAIAKAAELAGISDYKVIEYQKPLTLDNLLGLTAPEPQEREKEKAVAKGLSNALTPRLWYLAPQSELAGFSAAMGQ